MKYKITDINHDRKFVTLTVTFDDSTTYDKRMMVSDTHDADMIKEEVESWMKAYAPAREAEKKGSVPAKVTQLIGKEVSLTVPSKEVEGKSK